MYSKNTLMVLISLSFLVVIVQLTPVRYTKLSKHELYQIALKCLDEVNIDRAVVDEVLRTQILPRENRKYKEYLACSYKKQAYLSPDGKKFLYDNVFEFLQQFYDIKDLKTLNHCKQIQADDAAELSFQNLECILDGLRKIESENDTELEDIDSNNI